MSRQMIEAFLREMRERHQKEIDSVTLPEGTLEYLEGRVAEGDTETLLFMLKLGYLMGLQTGFAAARGVEVEPTAPVGPLKA